MLDLLVAILLGYTLCLATIMVCIAAYDLRTKLRGFTDVARTH